MYPPELVAPMKEELTSVGFEDLTTVEQVDSAITAALCTKSIGSEKILGLILPEKESDVNSKNLALQIAEKYNINTETIDITNILESMVQIGARCPNRNQFRYSYVHLAHGPQNVPRARLQLTPRVPGPAPILGLGPRPGSIFCPMGQMFIGISELVPIWTPGSDLNHQF